MTESAVIPHAEVLSVEEAEQAHKVYEEIELIHNSIQEQFLYMAERLYAVQEQEWYRKYYDYETFEEFLDSLTIKRAWAYELLRIWRRYVVELNIDTKKLVDIGASKLAAMAGTITNGNKDEWIERADSPISVRDLKREIGVAREVGAPRNDSPIEPGCYHLIPAEGVEAIGDPVGKRLVELIRTSSGIVARVS